MINETATPAPAKTSRWEDLVDVFLAPKDLFERRAEESWGKPFLLLCLIGLVLFYVFLPVNSLIMEAAMIENAPPNADLEQIRKGAVFMKYIGGIFVPIGYAFMIAVSALGLKLFSSLFEPAARWGQAFTIATYALFVTILQSILGVVMVYFKSRSGPVHTTDASFGVLHFMDKPDKIMTSILGRLDIFPIWTAVLCAVGLMVIVRMPRGKAIAVAAITWLFVALPGLAIAVLTGGDK